MIRLRHYLRARRVAKFRRVADELALVIWFSELVRKDVK